MAKEFPSWGNSEFPFFQVLTLLANGTTKPAHYFMWVMQKSFLNDNSLLFFLVSVIYSCVLKLPQKLVARSNRGSMISHDSLD